ncbi:hypothetical protein ABT104_12950 [Streptomyces mobaraensis]|uniref:hypothetical protein n=1 Tax=Streptomyces mobaraensis TaxID=35621 RepID=UPI00331DDD62
MPGEVPDVMLPRGIRETAATVVPLVPSLSEMPARPAARGPEPTSVRHIRIAQFRLTIGSSA